MANVSATGDLGIEAVLDCLELGGAKVVSFESRATDTRVWRVKHEGHSLAVRVFREEQYPAMQSELAALRLADQGGVPVPGVVSHGMVDGRLPAMAIDWVPGRIVGETLLTHPRLARRLGQNAGNMLARIHGLPLTDEAMSCDIGRDWMELGATSGSGIREALERVATNQASLLHLDFHPFNILSTGSRITGVIDWTNTMIGDPRADIARTVAIMRLVAPALVGRRGARRVTLGLFTRGLLAAYVAMRGPLANMPAFYAWAGQMMLRDLGPKLDMFPDPALTSCRIDEWNTHWRRLALESASR